MLRPNTFALTATLAMIVALGPIAMDSYLASLPSIAQEMRATTAQAQLTISIYLVGYAIAQIVYGPVSDRLGRRPVILFALVLFTLGSLTCAAAPSIEVLTAARFLQSLGGAGAVVTVRAIVRDLYVGPSAGRELSRIGSVMAVAPIAGPAIGGAVHMAFGWQANFLLVAAVGLIIATIFGTLVPETVRQPVREPLSVRAMIRNFGGFLREKRYLAYLGIITCSYAGLFAWISGASFVLQQIYALDPFTFGAAFGSSCAGYLIGTLLAARLVMRAGIDVSIGIGTLCQACGGLFMVLTVALQFESVVWLLLAISFYLFGLGFTGPQAMAGALMPYPDRAGAASSLFGFLQQCWAAVLGVAIGHMLGSTAWPMAAAIAAMGVGALLIWAMTRQVRR